MLEGARRLAIAAVISGSALVAPDVSPAHAGGCYKDSVLPECNPIVVRVERPRFSIQAMDFAHNGSSDVWIGSKTRQFIIFGGVTPDGANEGEAAVVEACGPNGDNSLNYAQRASSKIIVTSLRCIQQIP